MRSINNFNSSFLIFFLRHLESKLIYHILLLFYLFGYWFLSVCVCLVPLDQYLTLSLLVQWINGYLSTVDNGESMAMLLLLSSSETIFTQSTMNEGENERKKERPLGTRVDWTECIFVCSINRTTESLLEATFVRIKSPLDPSPSVYFILFWWLISKKSNDAGREREREIENPSARNF